MRVCVIGAGAAGLTTAKHLLEEGFEVTILEKRDGLGGLWYFDETKSSVTDSTTASTSKTYIQFSDFPMKQDTPWFPHHTEYLAYLMDYAREFQLLDHIQYNAGVNRLEKTSDGWLVDYGDDHHITIFDAVAVCSGLHHVPTLPQLPGLDAYQGRYEHSSLLKSGQELKANRVVVVGGGESAADLIHEIAPIAQHVYMSLRRGMAVTRHMMGDIPADYDSTRAKTWLPRTYLHDFNVDLRVVGKFSGFKTLYTLFSLPILLLISLFEPQRVKPALADFLKPESWRALFRPPRRFGEPDGVALARSIAEACQDLPTSPQEKADRIWKIKYIFDWYSGTMHNSQPFTKRIHFLEDVVEKRVTVVPGIKAFDGGYTVRFDDDRTLEADAVIMCTGFTSELPFYKDKHLDGRDLYKNVFTPGDNTLAFIGFIRPNIGSLPSVAEMQARWFAAVLADRVALPAETEMRAIIQTDAEQYTAKRVYHAKRLTSLADYWLYVSFVADELGVQPHLERYLTKPRLLFKLLFGPGASYQFRLEGHGAKPEVAEEIAKGLKTITWGMVLMHGILYIWKPFFRLLTWLGFKKFQPVY